MHFPTLPTLDRAYFQDIVSTARIRIAQKGASGMGKVLSIKSMETLVVIFQLLCSYFYQNMTPLFQYGMLLQKDGFTRANSEQHFFK